MYCNYGCAGGGGGGGYCITYPVSRSKADEVQRLIEIGKSCGVIADKEFFDRIISIVYLNENKED